MRLDPLGDWRRSDEMSHESIGHYQIIRKLGEGGVGEVFQAVDPTLQRPVALKRLRPELASREEVVERFYAEAKTLARLNHPNIATLYSFERDGDDLVMVMEYVEGETILALMQREGALPVARALPLFFQALEGLGYAHQHGIVHRDIKGSNLMLNPAGLLKVMDFGIARVLGSERVTLLGQLVGTPEFMSPEQVRGDEIDARADIYSLGILLYALLSGRVPFASRSGFDLMRAHVEASPPPLSKLATNLPDGLEAALRRALEKEPDDRYQTTAEFRAALEPFATATDAPVKAHPVREPCDPRSLAGPTQILPDDEPRDDEPGVDESPTQEHGSPPGSLADEEIPPDAPTREVTGPPHPAHGPRVAAGIVTVALVVIAGLALNLLWIETRSTTPAAANGIQTATHGDPVIDAAGGEAARAGATEPGATPSTPAERTVPGSSPETGIARPEPTEPVATTAAARKPNVRVTTPATSPSPRRPKRAAPNTPEVATPAGGAEEEEWLIRRR